MNILYISKYVGFGGLAPTRQYFLSRALADRGHLVMLVGSRSNAVASKVFGGLKQVWSEGRLTNVRLNGPSVRFGMNARRIFSWAVFEVLVFSQIRTFWKFKPDVLVVSSLSVLTLLSGAMLKMILGCKLVVEIRDIYPLTMVEIGGFGRLSPLVRLLGWVERIGYQNADLLISPLEKFDEHAASILGAPTPFEWIPMGFDKNSLSTKLTDSGSEIVASIDALKHSGKFVVIYAGTIGIANALGPLMETAIESRGSDLHFIILGDGPLKRKYKAEGIALENIDFIEPVPKADVRHILASCDLLIMPIHNKPIYRFGISPNKLIDYALSGRPFVTNLQTELEILRLYGNCFVTPNDSSRSLLATIKKIAAMPPSALNEMGERGRASLYRNFQYSVLAVKLVDALERHGLSGKTTAGSQ